LSEPRRASPDRLGEGQPPPDRPADAQPGEDSDDSEQWLAKLRAVRKRRDRANVLYRMAQALLGVEFEHRDMGRLDKQYGPIPVANAILRCAEDGGDADLERIVQILEDGASAPLGVGDGLDPQQRQSAAGDLRAVLEAWGVRPPNLERLLEHPTLTAQDALAWLLCASQENGLDKPVGYAINRMLAGDEPPAEFRWLSGLDERSRALFLENLERLESDSPLHPLPEALVEKFVAWAGMRGFGESEIRRALQRATGEVVRAEPCRADDRPPPHEEAWAEVLALVGGQYPLLSSFPRVELVPDGDDSGVVRLGMERFQRQWVENRGALRVLENAVEMVMGESWKVELMEDAD
jgi:hypothetical protein